MFSKALLTFALAGAATWNALIVWNHVIVPDHGRVSVFALMCLSPAGLYLWLIWLMWSERRRIRH